MADLRPIGSEKLEGIDKLKRIMEIATYNEAPKKEINNLSTTNYTIQLSDGNIYGIVQERQGYIIKKGMNESELDYSEPMKNRKYYRSYSEAMKKLNLIVAETNRITGNEYEIPLIGEQPEVKKKFVLKTPKKAEPTPEVEAPSVEPPAPMAPEAPVEPTGDMGMAPEMPAEPTDDMGMGGETPAEPTDDMGMMPDMGGEMPVGDEVEDIDIDVDEEGGTANLKLIQKLTGKLSQRLRMFDKDKGLDSQDIKYVINSIISAIDLTKLDDDDREDIVDKLEGFDEYGKEGEGDLEFKGEEDFNFGDEDVNVTDTEEIGSEPMGDEMPMEPETKEGYQTVMDSIFGESEVEKVLSSYFEVKEEETPILESKSKINFLKNKINKISQKEELKNLAINETQMKAGLVLMEEYENTKLIGRTNKNNLVFNINNKQVKLTPNGYTL
jgi:hypothetical protein